MMQRAFFDGGERPLVLGHRGDSAHFPENTLLSFHAAIKAGADGIELDVMRCESGEVVVVHDDDLGRVAGQAKGTGLPVRETALSLLQQVDIGQGQRVPTLADVLRELGDDVLLNIELKSREVQTAAAHVRLYRDDGLAGAVSDLLRRHPRRPGATLVSSFDPFQLYRFRQHLGRAFPLAFLAHAGQVRPLHQGWPAQILQVEAFHPQASLLDRATVRKWHQQGKRIHTWTVDDPHEVLALVSMGVDGIITNDPAAVRAVLDGQPRRHATTD
jgi:glycerophosphoryl diester phosphodiesterase